VAGLGLGRRVLGEEAKLYRHGPSALDTLVGAETLVRPEFPRPELHVPHSHPARVGRYVVRGLLGGGSMCFVYRAHDPEEGREVAVKVLKAPFAKDPRILERFGREASTGRRLLHPALVSVLDSGPDYLVQELVEGETLAMRLRRRGPICPDTALEILAAVAEGLDHAHAHAVVHRDVKPSNVLLPREGGAKLADFGIARLGWAPITATGEVLGSPAYMAPEQVSRCVVGAMSDLFSLAVVAQEVLTGVRPFHRPTLGTLLESIVVDAPPRASAVNPALPSAVDAVLAKALAKAPEWRYPSGRAFVSALRSALDHAALPCP
jgi:serine/threonine-protein kinase